MDQNDRRDDESRGTRRAAADRDDRAAAYSEQRDEQSNRQTDGDSRPALTQRERHERWPIG